MDKNFDFKEEWERTKAQLTKLSKEVVVLAKKGEKEIIKFSQKGKRHFDSTALSLKIERAYYLIGKEYAHIKNPIKPSVKLSKLVDEVKQFEKQLRVLRKK